MSSEPEVQKRERACPKCGGDLKWYRSEAVQNLGLVEHMFTCMKCGHLEKESRPPHQPES
jgi:predicted RNA-binding Zn-ribbon protein involved in translation (DUF1610 family)